MKITTPHGEFPVTRRARAGFSVVRVKRACCHRGKWRHIGDLVTVDHRVVPRFRTLIGNGWSEWVATYDLQGNEIDMS